MAEKSTFVKIDRNIRQWRWFKDPNTLAVWLWLILSANIEDHDFRSDTIRRGEIATSRRTIMEATGLTEMQVRTALNHLKATGEITVRLMPGYQVISIVCYDQYQAVATGKASGKQPASNRAVTGEQPQSKNIRTGKNGRSYIYVPPTAEEVEAYARAEGMSIDAQAFVDYNASRGWKGIDDWHPLVRTWARRTAPAGEQETDAFGRPIRKEFQDA